MVKQTATVDIGKSLALQLNQPRRKKPDNQAPAPDSLKVHGAKHDYPMKEKLPAHLLLEWAPPEHKNPSSPFEIKPDFAVALLELFPPCVFYNASSRALVGSIELSCLLLSSIDPRTEVPVKYISINNPLAQLNLPLHLLLPSKPLDEQISLISDLSALLGSTPLNHQMLGKLVGKDRSTISKKLSKK